MFQNITVKHPDTGKTYSVSFDARTWTALAIDQQFERAGLIVTREWWTKSSHRMMNPHQIEIVELARCTPMYATLQSASQAIIARENAQKTREPATPSVVPVKGTPARVVWDTIAELHKTNDVVLVSEVVDAMRKAGHKTTRFPIMPTMRAWHQYHENKDKLGKVQHAAKELRHEQDALKLAQQAVREGLDNHARAVGLPQYSDLAEALERLLSLDLPDVGAVRTAYKLLAKISG